MKNFKQYLKVFACTNNKLLKLLASFYLQKCFIASNIISESSHNIFCYICHHIKLCNTFLHDRPNAKVCLKLQKTHQINMLNCLRKVSTICLIQIIQLIDFTFDLFRNTFSWNKYSLFFSFLPKTSRNSFSYFYFCILIFIIVFTFYHFLLNYFMQNHKLLSNI